MTRVEYTHASEMGAREFENDRVAHGGSGGFDVCYGIKASKRVM